MDTTHLSGIPLVEIVANLRALAADLVSGHYEQGYGRLRKGAHTGHPKHCCLGVLCDRHVGSDGWAWDDKDHVSTLTRSGYETSYAPPPLADRYGLTPNGSRLDGWQHILPDGRRTRQSLSELNDSEATFEGIAFTLRAYADELEAGAELLTTKQVAAMIGVTTGRIRQIAAARKVGRRVGRDWLFQPDDVEKLRSGPAGRPPSGRQRADYD